MNDNGKIFSPVHVTSPFWEKYMEIVKEKMLPFQWDILNDKATVKIESERDDVNIPTEKSHVIANFLIAAGKKEGNHYGWLFQDSDLYKWIEAAANTYRVKPDEHLLTLMETCVELIEEAQDADGYLSTFYQIEKPQLKFRRLMESHELYCAGHLIEAAVAYAEATGDLRLIAVSDRFIACIKKAFGPNEGQINGADGHQEIELALVRLYEFTGNKDYLDLSYYFLNVRGQDPEFYHKQLLENERNGIHEGRMPHIDLVYLQAHKPVVEQLEPRGHAVRMVYMAQAMAGTAYYLNDSALLNAAKKIWESIVSKRMYITGGIGSTVRGEAFTYDYDLPTDTMYCETCAAIGLLNFTSVLQKSDKNSAYADIMERVLYNSMISGMSLDGEHFFYVNPLEVDPEASLKNPDKSHVKATRPSWFGCACCPPNLARTIPAIQRYIYDESEDAKCIWINQWIDSTGTFKNAILQQQHDFRNKKESTFTITNTNDLETEIFIRIPYWLDNVSVWVNGEEKVLEITDGYFNLILFADSIEVRLTYNMPVLKWQANPNVKSAYGKVAFQKGPFIYAAEESDNESALHLYHVNGEPVAIDIEDAVLGEITVIDVPAQKLEQTEPSSLYYLYQKPGYLEKNLRLIPYYCWANRDTGEMRVWLNDGGE